MNRLAIPTLAFALVLSYVQATLAQTQTLPPVASAPATSSQQYLLTDAQLDALISPVALYPDALLSQILIASTYPLEVVQAARWMQDNKKLKGDALKAAVDQQTWDDSVKSLVATPDVLDMMSQKLDWTQKLGDAVLAQQPDVMDAIQRLRAKAQSNNKLTSNKQQKVSTQQQGSKQVIVIEPTEPNTIYVPYYDPVVVYGPWPYPAYPPYYWPPPGYIGAGIIASGIAFGAGYALGRWASGGNYWGGSINWTNNNINIDRNGNRNWVHNPIHRDGVRYNNPDVANRFGGNRNNIAGGAQNRMDFRGRSGQQVLRPGAGAAIGAGAGAAIGAGFASRPNVGSGAGARPSTGDRKPGGRPGAGERPSPKRAAAKPTKVASRGSGNAFGNVTSGRQANLQAARGRASLGGGAVRVGGGGVARGGGRVGGRRSDVRLKHDVALLGHLDNGLGFYRFVYNGGHKSYVGVMAQEVQAVRPEAVVRGPDGYLRVYYDMLGLKFETYRAWMASGARIPDTAGAAH